MANFHEYPATVCQLTDHGADLPCHEHGHRFVVKAHIYDALPDGLAHFGPQQHGAQRLKDGSEDAGLPQRHHTRPHRGTKGVGNVVGTHGESQDEGNDEAKDHHPQVGLQIHLDGMSAGKNPSVEKEARLCLIGFGKKCSVRLNWRTWRKSTLRFPLITKSLRGEAQLLTERLELSPEIRD